MAGAIGRGGGGVGVGARAPPGGCRDAVGEPAPAWYALQSLLGQWRRPDDATLNRHGLNHVAATVTALEAVQTGTYAPFVCQQVQENGAEVLAAAAAGARRATEAVVVASVTGDELHKLQGTLDQTVRGLRTNADLPMPATPLTVTREHNDHFFAGAVRFAM